MNRLTYWKLRKWVQNIVFFIKKTIFKVLDSFYEFVEYKFVRKAIFRNTIIEILKGAVISFIVLKIEDLLRRQFDYQCVDKNVFVPCIIGGIGIAGVILGLYCSNVATVYSSRYANAPRVIANTFQKDKLIRKCISGIVDYIVFGCVILTAILKGIEISWIVVLVSVIWSVVVIVSYSIAGNRTYQLADIFNLADDSNGKLYRLITKKINKSIFADDYSFQNHFMKIAEEQIHILKTIQRYGINELRGEHAAMTEFMCRNLVLVDCYWKEKMSISQSSFWYRNKAKYQKWHLTSDIESSLALRTGTALKAKDEHDYWWFEDEMFSINNACVNALSECCDYVSLYSYYLAFNELCRDAIENREANYYISQVEYLRQVIERSMPKADANEETKKSYAGLVEAVSVLYLNLILETCKVYQEFDIESVCVPVLKAIDQGKKYEKNKYLRRRSNKEYYEKIITEVAVEGKRITPDWVIKQQVAKEEYVYLNTLLDVVNEGVNQALCLGKLFAEKSMFFEACIILVRFYEYETKLSRLFEVVNILNNDFEKYHIDKELTWDASRLKNLKNAMVEWKRDIPVLLSKCTCNFALNNWTNSEEYPDFLGESYNHICEDTVHSIVNDDIEQFSVDYENLSKLMALYQEYIRSDFMEKDNIYRVEFAYYMFTSPIVEWAQIGGLAILWGEFHSNPEWMRRVCQGSDIILGNKDSNVSERFIEYIQHRNRFLFGVDHRDSLEHGWQLDVANAIRESCSCEFECGLYGSKLKTDSKLLKAFCSNFMDFGFTTDPAEVFWVMCVNPHLLKEKRFKTKYSWDKGLYDD